MEVLNPNAETGCCERFDPKPWENKEITWADKLFVKDNVMAVFHIPLNIAQVITRMWAKIEAAGAAPKDFMSLAYDPSPWKSEWYMAVSKEVPGMENIKLSGTFLTKVFESPFKDAKKWVEQMQEYVASKGKELKKLYFYYTTCPKCAKYYGKNYVVGFAKV